MATKVAYKQGLKATYLGLAARDPNALYFCTDTLELFRGDHLYTDGIRFVANPSALPAFSKAADGILYYCTESGCGFVLNEARNAWLPLLRGVDQKTLTVNDSGLMSVLAVPITSVTGLEDRLNSIEERLVAGGGPTEGLSPVATAALNEEQFEIKDKVINLVAVDSAIVNVIVPGSDETMPLDEVISDIYMAILWEDMA